LSESRVNLPLRTRLSWGCMQSFTLLSGCTLQLKLILYSNLFKQMQLSSHFTFPITHQPLPPKNQQHTTQNPNQKTNLKHSIYLNINPLLNATTYIPQTGLEFESHLHLPNI
jgi:hypothetical protein